MAINLDKYPRPTSFEGREDKEGLRILRRRIDKESGNYTFFNVKPLSPIIGAEIEGIDLSKPLSPELKEELNEALLEWKVIFFRDQKITSEQQIAFARNFGELEVHPFYQAPEDRSEEVVQFHRNQKNPGFENVWHHDVSFREKPAKAAVLRLIEAPPVGGDTIWADMGAAYDNLPEKVKEKIDKLQAIHDFTPSFSHLLSPEELVKYQKKFPAVAHPVVRTHPETGRKVLFVNPSFTTRIIGIDKQESEELLNFLFRQAHIPEYQVRFHWEPNSIAFWDNRATQHYAVSDYFPYKRIVERVTIAGDRPY
ncbi:taurine dioxygenase [Neobacillus thermocopriae]|uniref:Taurine dioxygenase n=1 Tax=Neobacillus thermocopriae TaxID=1215031 RepID=A0A6B3TP13_9BACI|nr:taurine dioxygenase [Neobacillus thermocopriae]MED3624445.1 taurine dioxygenase [Neobacillus thermocopriae]MED3714836.1 taurine dioxygenase [Neobacillus thermocopriae]NEX78725.1 taurine dioxygenase [Neobacillus thermocopriae]